MNDLLNTLTAATAASVALALSDGTPVEFVKVTKKDNIQVRVPTSHDELGDDPLRIFRRDGTHYKDATELKLVATANESAAAPAAAPTPAAAPAASNDNTVYTVDGMDFDSLEDAKAEAISLYDGTSNVEITATIRKVVGVVGFSPIAA